MGLSQEPCGKGLPHAQFPFHGSDLAMYIVCTVTNMSSLLLHCVPGC
jgi:hypothetical protein